MELHLEGRGNEALFRICNVTIIIIILQTLGDLACFPVDCFICMNNEGVCETFYLMSGNF